MQPPVLYSLDVEEALVSSLLLHEDYAGLEECADEELWFDHLHPVVGCVRQLRELGKPTGTVFVLAALEQHLDSLSWRGDRGEELILDLLSRRLTDVQSYYGRQLGRMVHYYAQRRQALKDGQVAAVRAYRKVVESPGLDAVKGDGFIDSD